MKFLFSVLALLITVASYSQDSTMNTAQATGSDTAENIGKLTGFLFMGIIIWLLFRKKVSKS